MSTVCAICKFQGDSTTTKASYALSLFAPDVSTAYEDACAWSSAHVLSGVAAYCSVCNKITWLCPASCTLDEALVWHYTRKQSMHDILSVVTLNKIRSCMDTGSVI